MTKRTTGKDERGIKQRGEESSERGESILPFFPRVSPLLFV
jgi:hypothetical protein